MKLLNVDTLQQARDKLLKAAAGKIPDIEYVSFDESMGRILAKDLLSKENIPDFRKSTVDGYAVKAKDTQGVTESIPVFLEVTEEVAMGKAPEKTLKSGQAAYVPTGGMLPDGADAVVMMEYAEKFDESSIAVYDSVSFGRNVIQIGEDIEQGQKFLKKGCKVRFQEVGVMSSAGFAEVPVFKPWKMTVISTGDELVDALHTPERGQTRDINTYSLTAAGKKYGFEILEQKVLKDSRECIKEAIENAMHESDIVIVSGGSSQGDKDYTAGIMDELASCGVLTHGIALKPGKPTILAYDEDTRTVLAGLPGHPVAAVLVFELIIAWLYRKLTGSCEPLKTSARISENVSAAGGKTVCLLVELEEEKKGEDGICTARPVFGKSGLMTMMTRADGYTLIDVNDEGLAKDEIVQVTLF